MSALHPVAHSLLSGHRPDTTAAEAQEFFTSLVNGAYSPATTGGLLVALNHVLHQDAQAGLLLGALVRVLQHEAVASLQAPPEAIDLCGTGGDGLHTLNISTAAALVVAACGVPVVKHGNRASSSRCGSADVLQALGVDVDAPVAAWQRSLEQTGLAFLFAPHYHPALKALAPLRRELGVPTIINLAAPLANPASPARQMIGVAKEEMAVVVARALQENGRGALVVRGDDGMDEITVTTSSTILYAPQGSTVLRQETLEPATVGLSLYPPAALQGGDAAFNAAALHRLLQGERGGYRDAVLVNAAMALRLAADDALSSLPYHLSRAATALDSGQALQVLEGLPRA